MDEYYVGKDITVRFKVSSDGKNASIIKAKVNVYDEDKQHIIQDSAKIDKNGVRYTLKGNKVQKKGKYAFIFDVNIRNVGTYTHRVDVMVKHLPVPKEQKDAR